MYGSEEIFPRQVEIGLCSGANSFGCQDLTKLDWPLENECESRDVAKMGKENSLCVNLMGLRPGRKLAPAAPLAVHIRGFTAQGVHFVNLLGMRPGSKLVSAAPLLAVRIFCQLVGHEAWEQACFGGSLGCANS